MSNALFLDSPNLSSEKLHHPQIPPPPCHPWYPLSTPGPGKPDLRPGKTRHLRDMCILLGGQTRVPTTGCYKRPDHSTPDIWGDHSLLWGCLKHQRTLRSITDLHPLDANSMPLLLPVTSKCLQTWPKSHPKGGRGCLSTLRTTGLNQYGAPQSTYL